MRQTIRVNEYYDLFDIKTLNSVTSQATTNVPSVIPNTEQTNPFRGFWNDTNYNTAQKPLDLITVIDKYKSPQATNSLTIDDKGNIYCYPPNVSVPYWSKIIFRNYDYTINPNTDTSVNPLYLTLREIASSHVQQYTFPFMNYTKDSLTVNVPIPYALWNENNTTGTIINQDVWKQDFSNVSGVSLPFNTFYDFSKVPLFLRFDEYPSRSKVIFSGCDKTRNPDIEFRFDYKKGQMEPIKLNLSLSANTPVRAPIDFDAATPVGTYNLNLELKDIQNNLKSCYWCIEWIYEPAQK